ncbi:VOC family protein [Rhodococcus sp. NBC_00297]|uniref:VOC family protein n=1 Tax=Rhodococcus sp. NBC_00297 TaxID=2976005 RepID=UPI002E2BA922|nr:VOC family protein [Rhodococcus sp. NBC_00297]
MEAFWPHQLDVSAVRFARPTARYDEVLAFYRDIVGLPVLAQWLDHHGYDGVVFGLPDSSVQMELLHVRAAPSIPDPNPENQLVLYLDGPESLLRACDRLTERGQTPIASANPYWTENGAATFVDPDGWIVVLAPRTIFGPPVGPVQDAVNHVRVTES